MYSPQMPGSFILDTPAPVPPKLDLDTGAKGPNVFQPPNTPSAASSLHRSVTSSSFSYSGATRRKRTRFDYTDRDETPLVCSPGTASPAPLANSQYSLADGFDTPTASTAAAYEKHASAQLSLEADYRPNRGNQYADSRDSYFSSVTPGPLSRERNGQGRTNQSPYSPSAWPKTVLNVVGNVAGKVWEFCWSGGFKGFHAGGGQGYGVQQCRDTHGWALSEKDDVFRDGVSEQTPIPGGFPSEDVIPDYMAWSHTSTTPPRGSKKVLRENNGGEMRGSWVMVDRNAGSRDGSPVRSTTRKLPKSQNASPRRLVTASRPGSRRTILAPSRPSLTSHAGSPALHSSHPASYASPRSPASTPTGQTGKARPKIDSSGPLTPDVQRQIARAKKREKQDDASIRRMTQQLSDLIKQGREALGTKVEIEDNLDSGAEDEVDEGYAEGEYVLEKRRPWEDIGFDDADRKQC